MKRTLSILLMLALMAAACVFAEGDQEAENYTRYFDYAPVENAPIGMVTGENHNTLVLYFSRVGNTAFPEEVDAVSYASSSPATRAGSRASSRSNWTGWAWTTWITICCTTSRPAGTMAMTAKAASYSPSI